MCDFTLEIAYSAVFILILEYLSLGLCDFVSVAVIHFIKHDRCCSALHLSFICNKEICVIFDGKSKSIQNHFVSYTEWQ